MVVLEFGLFRKLEMVCMLLFGLDRLLICYFIELLCLSIVILLFLGVFKDVGIDMISLGLLLLLRFVMEEN